MLREKALVPFESIRRIRARLHNLIWPTDEEAAEYRRQLRLLEEQDWYLRGEADAKEPSPKGHPPHNSCPCNLCRKYWEGFWSSL